MKNKNEKIRLPSAWLYFFAKSLNTTKIRNKWNTWGAKDERA